MTEFAYSLSDGFEAFIELCDVDIHADNLLILWGELDVDEAPPSPLPS